MCLGLSGEGNFGAHEIVCTGSGHLRCVVVARSFGGRIVDNPFSGAACRVVLEAAERGAERLGVGEFLHAGFFAASSFSGHIAFARFNLEVLHLPGGRFGIGFVAECDGHLRLSDEFCGNADFARVVPCVPVRSLRGVEVQGRPGSFGGQVGVVAAHEELVVRLQFRGVGVAENVVERHVGIFYQAQVKARADEPAFGRVVLLCAVAVDVDVRCHLGAAVAHGPGVVAHLIDGSEAAQRG